MTPPTIRKRLLATGLLTGTAWIAIIVGVLTDRVPAWGLLTLAAISIAGAFATRSLEKKADRQATEGARA